MRDVVCPMFIEYTFTVKPALRGHLWDKEDKWPFKIGSIHI